MNEPVIRTFMKLVNDEWIPCKLFSIKKDDFFRQLDNIETYNSNGCGVFKATSDPYYNEDGRLIINSEIC
ncbi:hypothetical protein F4V43_01775 [Paenibacillus spiritus]|uniref:Uncharacterized protein n=1 Tax=Paenibacillus spiritus TaxID=2496557 RepID=A0A5J5GGV0_9BACL|nr:hypothetical protein [Paenibacillus spiritus]KAA9007240.1 hypothetical protein F4V43_01775 [Paenibacillus spiritus]